MKKYFNVIQAVSPSDSEGEAKNQDRILFDPKTNTACVCDGTTSSPSADQAASIVSRCSPLILNNDVNKNIKTIVDLLMAHRNLAIKKGVKAVGVTNESMRMILEDAAKENLKKSFQTTLVCAAFERQQRNILAKILSCGDSGFFAFSPDGQLLLSNLSKVDEKPVAPDNGEGHKICFSPGTELLVKVVGPLSRFPMLANNTGISSLKSWAVCRTVCLWDNSKPQIKTAEHSVLWLQPNELLLSPGHLISATKNPVYKKLRCLNYSRFIRQLSSPAQPAADMNFDMRGNITAVLPDHYYTGKWDYFEERFSQNTHFLLCSDGFYHAFSNTAGMWEWLKRNERNLTISLKKKTLLNELHHKLDKKCGDDDISFIWVRPKSKRKNSDASRTY
ncbi:MAG TPA: protein phosphatase 2C domain-containing protein [Anaerohalosphaeraceae bacterium]|nr:protein phosphatase 2C domain-containing protein [Anaerohalosphaeraceae bacterium]